MGLNSTGQLSLASTLGSISAFGDSPRLGSPLFGELQQHNARLHEQHAASRGHEFSADAHRRLQRESSARRKQQLAAEIDRSSPHPPRRRGRTGGPRGARRAAAAATGAAGRSRSGQQPRGSVPPSVARRPARNYAAERRSGSWEGPAQKSMQLKVQPEALTEGSEQQLALLKRIVADFARALQLRPSQLRVHLRMVLERSMGTDATVVRMFKYLQGTGQDIASAFARMDQDGSGELDADELQGALRSMGLRISEEEIDRVIAAIDKDGDGTVSLDEFKGRMDEITVQSTVLRSQPSPQSPPTESKAVLADGDVVTVLRRCHEAPPTVVEVQRRRREKTQAKWRALAMRPQRLRALTRAAPGGAEAELAAAAAAAAPPSEEVCYHCRQPGHWKAECPSLARGEPPAPVPGDAELDKDTRAHQVAQKARVEKAKKRRERVEALQRRQAEVSRSPRPTDKPTPPN
jgi:hypothetical protein